MAQKTHGWRRILSVPAVYRLAQGSIGSQSSRAILVEQYIRPWPGARVLDIGCGTGDFVERLPGVAYLGYDPSADYIDAARQRFGARAQFLVGGVGEVEVEPASFDLCVAKGVLHHLDEPAAHALFEDAHAALVPGGRLITIDPVFDDDQSRFARFLAERDRGQNVRTLAAYRQLAASSFDVVEGTVRHDLLRVPYSHAILICTK